MTLQQVYMKVLDKIVSKEIKDKRALWDYMRIELQLSCCMAWKILDQLIDNPMFTQDNEYSWLFIY